MRKFCRWLILGALLASGCTGLPADGRKGVWPWEYGTGQGEPNISDHAAFRAGVAQFGAPPEAVRPVTLNAAEPHPSAASVATEEAAAKAPPAAADGEGRGTAGRAGKNGYDFRVKESRSAAPSDLVLGTSTPSYDITAANGGNAPVSVAIQIDQGSARNVSADRKLPHTVVVPANSERLLIRFSPRPKGSGFDLKYSSVWSIGDYTATHDCPERYRFPFGEKVRAYAVVTGTAYATPFTRNSVVFSVPKGTPVLAARKGTVVRVGSDGRVDILHADSTIGTYAHLERIGEHVTVGRVVPIDDVIGVAGTSEDGRDAYLQLTVWRPEPTATDGVRAGSQRIGFEAVSFPMAFAGGSTNGTVLTKSQPVSRGNLPVSNRQTKRRRSGP